MNEDQLSDLKQFIAATVLQATADMATKEEIALLETKEDLSKLENQIKDLRLEVRDGFAGIGEAIEQINDQYADNMDRRVTRLEQQAA